MSSNESITIGPREHGKLGVYHCDVPSEGRVAVVGVAKYIDDGDEIVFPHVGITVKRNGEDYSFNR